MRTGQIKDSGMQVRWGQHMLADAHVCCGLTVNGVCMSAVDLQVGEKTLCSK